MTGGAVFVPGSPKWVIKRIAIAGVAGLLVLSIPVAAHADTGGTPSASCFGQLVAKHIIRDVGETPPEHAAANSFPSTSALLQFVHANADTLCSNL
jgi:hypothetical protein